MKPTRAHFLRTALEMMGLPYLWGGRSRHGVDCSGLVVTALYEASAGTEDMRGAWNSDTLWNSLPETLTPRPGDLAFYGGKRANDVSHVMLVLCPEGTPGLERGMVYGATGGDSTTTTTLAAARVGAKAKPKTAVRYRAPDDFRGYRSMDPFFAR